MLDFTFDDKKYQLPQSWSEVNLKQLQAWIKLSREELGDYERAGKAVSVFTGIDYDYLSQFDSKLVLTLMSHLGFLATEANVEPVQHFEIEGQTFYVNTLQDSIFKEFATFSKIDSDFKDKPEDAYSLKLAVLCRKQDESFLDVENILSERAELFSKLDAVTVLKVNAFFLTKLRLLSLNLNQFSELQKVIEGKEKELIQHLTINTAGFRWLTRWQVAFYMKIKSLLKRLYRS